MPSRVFERRDIPPLITPEPVYDSIDDTEPQGPPASAERQLLGATSDSASPYQVLRAQGRPVRSFLTVPDGLRGAATVPGATAVAGVALIAVLLAVVLLGRWWWQEAESKEARIPAMTETLSSASHSSATGESDGAPSSRVGTAQAQDPAIAPASEAASTPQTATESSTVVVHVAGKVRKPGVVTLPAEARVVDAVKAAGGMAPGADAQTVNLARPVVDGEQIIVLALGEPAKATPGAGAAAALGAGTTQPATSGKVDLNRADQAQLETLPGVGPVLAGRIIEWRTRNGKFSSVEELGEVSGVGEKTLAALTPLVTV